MDRFAEALLSRQANSALPLEDDWFAPLLGDWEFDYQDRSGRRLQGEWYFRRALDGMAIEDLFICLPGTPGRRTPSRTGSMAQRCGCTTQSAAAMT